MTALKRIMMIVFVVATVLGVGFLAVYWIAGQAFLPTFELLRNQQWFFILESALLAIVAIGVLAILVRAIVTPSLSSQFVIKKDFGDVEISKSALSSTVHKVVDSHRSLKLEDVKTKIVDKDDPKLRMRVKINPGRNNQLEQLGTQLNSEIATAVQMFTGHPVDELKVKFSQPDTSYARTSDSKRVEDTTVFPNQAQPVDAVPAR